MGQQRGATKKVLHIKRDLLSDVKLFILVSPQNLFCRIKFFFYIFYIPIHNVKYQHHRIRNSYKFSSINFTLLDFPTF